MHKTIIITVVALALAAPAAAQRVYVDYSPLADFGSYRTFKWAETPSPSVYDNNPLNHSRIKHTVEYYLIRAGMTEVDDDPDLYVTYHGESSEDFEINTSILGYGFATDWQWDPYWGNASGMTTTTGRTYSSGTLVIDIWDAKTKKLIWRGVMEGTLTDDLRKGAKKIDQGIEKMVKKWRKMRAKELK